MCDCKYYCPSPYNTVVEITDLNHTEDDFSMSFPRLIFGVDECVDDEDIREMFCKSFRDMEITHIHGNLINYDLPISCCLSSLKTSIKDSIKKIKEGHEELLRMDKLYTLVHCRT